MRRKISVSDWHVTWGVPCKQDCCPIAMAIKEEFRTDDVSVELDEVYFQHGKEYFQVNLPIRAQRFIMRFDAETKRRAGNRCLARKPAKPFNFFIELPAVEAK